MRSKQFEYNLSSMQDLKKCKAFTFSFPFHKRGGSMVFKIKQHRLKWIDNVDKFEYEEEEEETVNALQGMQLIQRKKNPDV